MPGWCEGVCQKEASALVGGWRYLSVQAATSWTKTTPEFPQRSLATGDPNGWPASTGRHFAAAKNVPVIKPNPETIQKVENLIEALAELRRVTLATETDVKRALRLTLAGADITTALEAVNPAGTREAMNEALAGVEAARHAMRRRIFELGLDEGLSIAALGRAFGFSRQLAARYAKEAKGRRLR
jgi:hypothetical protein